MKTVETVDGLEIDCERIVSFRTVALSPYEGPVIVKMMILTDNLGEAVEKTLKMAFKTLNEACKFMNFVGNPPKELGIDRISELYVIGRN